MVKQSDSTPGTTGWGRGSTIPTLERMESEGDILASPLELIRVLSENTVACNGKVTREMLQNDCIPDNWYGVE